jgi:hypothetical protein
MQLLLVYNIRYKIYSSYLGLTEHTALIFANNESEAEQKFKKIYPTAIYPILVCTGFAKQDGDNIWVLGQPITRIKQDIAQ